MPRLSIQNDQMNAALRAMESRNQLEKGNLGGMKLPSFHVQALLSICAQPAEDGKLEMY